MAADCDVAAELVRLGQERFDSPPRKLADETGSAEANRLLNDLDGHPHVFVLGCLAMVRVNAKRAWLMPFNLGNRLGGHSFEHMASQSSEAVINAMINPAPLHAYPQRMAGRASSALRRIRRDYDGDASKIWSNSPSSAEVVYRFLQFDGFGPKLACMTANLLVRDFGVRLSDHYSIDVSVDVHVRRIFPRAGLVLGPSSDEALIYKARAINPEYPGVVDFPVWDIGNRWCRPRKPRCTECRIGCCCPKAGVPA